MYFFQNVNLNEFQYIFKLLKYINEITSLNFYVVLRTVAILKCHFRTHF